MTEVSNTTVVTPPPPQITYTIFAINHVNDAFLSIIDYTKKATLQARLHSLKLTYNKGQGYIKHKELYDQWDKYGYDLSHVKINELEQLKTSNIKEIEDRLNYWKERLRQKSYDKDKVKKMVTCQCGEIIETANITSHGQSIRHLEYLSKLKKLDKIEAKNLANKRKRQTKALKYFLKCVRLRLTSA